MPTASDRREHLYNLLKDFDTAMLVTRAGDGRMHARPMAVAELRPNGDAYFATNLQSPKIGEIEHDPRVTVTFQARGTFASLTGTAEVMRDRALINRLWSESWRVWFPGGKDDPSLCLLRIDATAAEYWDASGAEGLKFLFKAAAAYVSGGTPTREPKGHGKIDL